MRVAVETGELPEPMCGAWHVDVHVGSVTSLLLPEDLVSAVFMRSFPAFRVGEALRTIVGRFDVEEVARGSDSSHVLLRTEAPGLVSHFALGAAPSEAGAWNVRLCNSVHPSSRLGRAYFRAIEPFHHLMMEMALRRIAKRAGKESTHAG